MLGIDKEPAAWITLNKIKELQFSSSGTPSYVWETRESGPLGYCVEVLSLTMEDDNVVRIIFKANCESSGNNKDGSILKVTVGEEVKRVRVLVERPKRIRFNPNPKLTIQTVTTHHQVDVSPEDWITLPPNRWLRPNPEVPVGEAWLKISIQLELEIPVHNQWDERLSAIYAGTLVRECIPVVCCPDEFIPIARMRATGDYLDPVGTRWGVNGAPAFILPDDMQKLQNWMDGKRTGGQTPEVPYPPFPPGWPQKITRPSKLLIIKVAGWNAGDFTRTKFEIEFHHALSTATITIQDEEGSPGN